VVFMPRCERWLYENFLYAHSTSVASKERALSQVLLFGNSFKVFSHQRPQKHDGDPGTSAERPDPQESYLRGHTEVKLPVKQNQPFWTALCGISAHFWAKIAQ